MIERLLALLNRIPADKVAHFAGGSIVAAVGFLAGPFVSLYLVLAVGLGKELWDSFNPPHVADPWDLVATLLGGLPVWCAVVLSRWL